MSGREIQAQEAEQTSQVLGNEYYKKLQQELKEKNRLNTVQSDKDRDRHDIDDSHKVKAIVASGKTQEVAQKFKFQDAVQIRSLLWEKDSEGNFQLKDKDVGMPTAVDLSHTRPEQLRSIGYKIDYKDKLAQLKQSLMQTVVQSRSGNFFLSVYAKFKVGLMVQMLSVLGVSPEELGQLQKQALANAVQENISLMSENMYNAELADLIQGGSKKRSKKALSMFREVEAQLIAQMQRLGRPDYWTELRIAEERLAQCRRIHEEFNKEHKDLLYQRQFYYGQ